MYKFAKWLSFWLVIIGALNWGLFGLFQIDIVALLLGEMTLWAKIVYIIIGISAIIFGAMCYLCRRDYDCD